MSQSYSHLSALERVEIEKLHCERGLGVRRTAEAIGRSPLTVSREPGRGLWFASNESESYRPYRPKRLKSGGVDVRPVLLGADRAAQGRPATARVPQTPSHGLGPAAPVGAGRAAPRLVAPAGRGQAEGRVPGGPGDEDQP